MDKSIHKTLRYHLSPRVGQRSWMKPRGYIFMFMRRVGNEVGYDLIFDHRDQAARVDLHHP
jgi:hypothetical protein